MRTDHRVDDDAFFLLDIANQSFDLFFRPNVLTTDNLDIAVAVLHDGRADHGAGGFAGAVGQDENGESLLYARQREKLRLMRVNVEAT